MAYLSLPIGIPSVSDGSGDIFWQNVYIPSPPGTLGPSRLLVGKITEQRSIERAKSPRGLRPYRRSRLRFIARRYVGACTRISRRSSCEDRKNFAIRLVVPDRLQCELHNTVRDGLFLRGVGHVSRSLHHVHGNNFRNADMSLLREIQRSQNQARQSLRGEELRRFL